MRTELKKRKLGNFLEIQTLEMSDINAVELCDFSFAKYITFYLLRYTIVGGDFASNFSIDRISGKIEPIGMIDFETVSDDTQNSLQFSPR